MQTYNAPQKILIDQADAYRHIVEGRIRHLLRDGTTGSFSEKHIQCIWFDPTLRPHRIFTRTGEEVSVMDPGRWNQEAGPDFLDAVLMIKPELRRVQGDVEIHIHPADWEHHGHARDKRYNRVIAHVTFFAGLTHIAGLPPGTIEIALEPTLTQNPAFRMDSIDTSAYPFDARLPQCACGVLLKEQAHVDPISLLYTAGCYRFEQKVNTMAVAIQHGRVPDLLYLKTMAALGYKQHTKAFTHLAERVPLDTIAQHTPLEAYAILMGTAGLLPASLPLQAPAQNQKFLRCLWDIWWQYRDAKPARPALDWKGPAGRPTNLPSRRLAAAATLFTQPDPWQHIKSALTHTTSLRNLQHLFVPTGPLAFWIHHTSLEQPASSRPKALVGNDRLAAWINNVVLPLAAAHGHPPAQLLPLFMPEQLNAVVRQTATRLLGRDHNPSLYRSSGLLQQGLIQIFHDFCRSGCHDCALANALRQGAFLPTPCTATNQPSA